MINLFTLTLPVGSKNELSRLNVDERKKLKPADPGIPDSMAVG